MKYIGAITFSDIDAVIDGAAHVHRTMPAGGATKVVDNVEQPGAKDLYIFAAPGRELVLQRYFVDMRWHELRGLLASCLEWTLTLQLLRDTFPGINRAIHQMELAGTGPLDPGFRIIYDITHEQYLALDSLFSGMDEDELDLVVDGEESERDSYCKAKGPLWGLADALLDVIWAGADRCDYSRS